MPDAVVRPRRAPLSTWGMRLHRVATAVARVALRLHLPRRASARATPKVTILLVHAWGMGGTIRTMLNVAGALAERYDVEVLSVWRTRGQPFFAFPPGVTVTAADDRRAGASGRAARVLRRFRGALLFPGDRTAARTTLWSDVQLVRRLRASRPDVLIGSRPALNLLVATAGGARALVASEHTPFDAYNARLKREIARRYGALDAVVVLGAAERERLLRAVGAAVPVDVIPNGVPPLRRPGAARLDQPVIVGAGRLARAKGFDQLIRAFALVTPPHPEWRLRICGGGEERDALAALIDQFGLGERAVLPGRVRDIEAELEAASVFALSSRLEGLPIVLLEAMAKGLAVVSFDCSAGVREVIEHGVDGLLVPAGDVLALAHALVQLIESEVLRRRLGAAATRKAAAYGLDAMAARWAALIERLTCG